MGDPRSVGNSLPVVGGLLESLWGSPEQEAMQRALKRAREAYGAYRPQAHQMRMNAMNQTMRGAWSPYNNMMMNRYGQQAGVNFDQLLADPMPQGMMNTSAQKRPAPRQTQAYTPDSYPLLGRNG